MKKQFFIANWKSHKNTNETIEWLEAFRAACSESMLTPETTIILCPPFPLLPLCKEFIDKFHMPMHLGTQTISSYPEGAYTGEVCARLVKDFATHTLIGHSERRRLLHETEADIQEQVQLARAHHIEPIVLMSDKDATLPQGADIIIYEPPTAISSDKGKNPENPEDVEAVARFLKKKNSVLYVLYGGSVSAENVHTYSSLPTIDGVIVGAESLNPHAFAQIIQHA